MSQTVLAGNLFDQKTGNLLANGGFELWSLGTSFISPADAATLADGWVLSRTTPDATITRESGAGNFDTGGYSLKINITSVGTGVYRVKQQISETVYAGKTVSISARVKTSLAGVKVTIQDSNGSVLSTAHTGSGNWETLKLSRTTAVGITFLQGGIGWYDVNVPGTGAVYIDSVIMIVGNIPVDYVPENPEIEKVMAGAITSLQGNTPNILVNGGFEIWQRGNLFTNPITLAYTADKWQYETNGSANTTIERSGVMYEGLYSLSLVMNSIGSSTFLNMTQNVEGPAKYRGKTLTLSMRVRANTANAVQLQITDSGGTSNSSFHTGGDTYELLTVTRAINAATTELIIRCGWVANFTATKYFIADSAMLVIGNQSINYVPEVPQVEMDKCLRYYEISQPNVEAWIPVHKDGAGTNRLQIDHTFKAVKSAVPTVTITKSYLTMGHDALSGSGNGGDDTAQWTLTAGGISVNGFNSNGVRSVTQSTYPLVNPSYSWKAEV